MLALSPFPGLQVAVQALEVILPAWVAAGNSLQELAATVVGALPHVSPHRRLSLLSALVAVVPQVCAWLGGVWAAHIPFCQLASSEP